MLTPIGQLKDLEGPVIARVDACDGYNTNGGCKRWECKREIESSDPFDVRSGYFVEDGDHSINLSSPRLGFSDCRATCLSNCSYVAFASLYENGTGCRFWTDMSMFLQSNSVGSTSVYMLSSKPSRKGEFACFVFDMKMHEVFNFISMRQTFFLSSFIFYFFIYIIIVQETCYLQKNIYENNVTLIIINYYLNKL